MSFLARANGDDKLFFQERNYNFFLKRYDNFLYDYLETYAYNLLQNHFHLLVRVKSEESLLAAAEKNISSINSSANLIQNATARNDISSRNVISKRGDFSEMLSEQFRRLFISYSKSINIQESRTGNLFQRSFKRKLIDNPKYFKHIIYYIHHQPSHHGYEIEDLDYPHSSYLSFLTEKNTKLMREEVLKWFGDKNHFREFHRSKQKLNDIEQFIIEDD